MLNSNIFPTRPYNMVNFGPLAAEIVSLVWGTPGNFNGFRVLAALLLGTLAKLCGREMCKNDRSDEMPFGLWTRLSRRKHFLQAVHIGATWRIRLTRPCAAAMRPYVILL